MAKVADRDEAEVWRVVFGEGGLQTRYESGELDDNSFCDLFRESLNTRVANLALLEAAGDIFEPNREIVTLLHELKRSGLPMGILSNTCAAHWQDAISKYVFLNDCFQTFALSHELKAAKPGREIYVRAANLIGSRPSEVFFVDDRADNVVGACEAGYDAVLYESVAGLREDLLVRGVLAGPMLAH